MVIYYILICVLNYQKNTKMKLTKLWIEKQQRPCEFQKTNSSFTISDKKEMEKVRQS